MGLLDFMNRMVNGEPVFQDNSANNETKDKTDADPAATVQPPEDVPTGPVIRKGDDSSFPVVYIKRTKTRIDGAKMQVYCQIVNKWPEEIELDKITMLGVKRELDVYLRGGEEREFLVYDGPRVDHESHEAQLDYKTKEERDYFQAIHDITFTYHVDDKTYSVNEMHLREPIRDIYG